MSIIVDLLDPNPKLNTVLPQILFSCYLRESFQDVAPCPSHIQGYPQTPWQLLLFLVKVPLPPPFTQLLKLQDSIPALSPQSRWLPLVDLDQQVRLLQVVVLGPDAQGRFTPRPPPPVPQTEMTIYVLSETNITIFLAGNQLQKL